MKAAKLESHELNIKDDPYLARQAKLEQDKADLLARLLGKKARGKFGKEKPVSDRFVKTLSAEKAFEEESRAIR